MHITYRFQVTLTLPLTTDPDAEIHTMESATTTTNQRDLEKKLFRSLKPLANEFIDGQHDVELLDYEVDDSHDSECSCETCRMNRAQSEAEEPRR